MKYLVANSDGQILRSIECGAEHALAQAGPGQIVWALPIDASRVADDQLKIVDGILVRFAPGESWGEGLALTQVEN